MHPEPQSVHPALQRGALLRDKKVIITGGDSGIGRAVAIGAAMQGADVAVIYKDEPEDAQTTRKAVEALERQYLDAAGDIGSEAFCRATVERFAGAFGKIDVLINNSGEQHQQKSIEDITEEQLERTFRTNIFAMFFMVKAALPHMGEGSSIINTASITAYEGNPTLVDYASTKGAIVAFTRSLSTQLLKRGIRVNAVAPGPIWTPLIPATFDESKVKEFGKNTPMGRPGQPSEVAPAYLFLASDLASYISGQTIHVNGGTIING
jgi:NAD(P)-dependent dehydrogenase (short-subunit alcohol dehydrogenase family)